MNPESQDAIANGCTCPILDNAHGRGHLGDGDKYGWWMDVNCPIHRNPPAQKDSLKSLGSKGFENTETK